ASRSESGMRAKISKNRAQTRYLRHFRRWSVDGRPSRSPAETGSSPAQRDTQSGRNGDATAPKRPEGLDASLAVRRSATAREGDLEASLEDAGLCGMGNARLARRGGPLRPDFGPGGVQTG